MDKKQTNKSDHRKPGCDQDAHSHHCDFPEFKRLNYFHGQLLGFQDFRTEQAYFREKMKLHNRCLHGYGTVCGLMVRPELVETVCEPDWASDYRSLNTELSKLLEEKKSAIEKNDQQTAAELQKKIEELKGQLAQYPSCELPLQQSGCIEIECGFALDCQGNELLVRRYLKADLWRLLSVEDRETIKKNGESSLYISLCYCALPVEPMRPVLQDACAVTPDCVAGKLLDTVRIKVTVNPPLCDCQCETCCSDCPDPCLLLARIDRFVPGIAIQSDQIHNEVRRFLSTYPYTSITGVSWTHGGIYNEDQARELLGTDNCTKGLKIQLSRPVYKSTLCKGVVDLWVVQAGKTRSADIYALEVDFEYDSPGETTDTFYIRYTGDENLDPGDRVMIIIRAPFILDECCRPVDGAHVGGRIPIINSEEYKPFYQQSVLSECIYPSRGYGPWTSGTGYPGANFESWFYIAKSEHKTPIKKSLTGE